MISIGLAFAETMRIMPTTIEKRSLIVSTVFNECIVGSPVISRITGLLIPWSQHAPVEPSAGTDDRGPEDERRRS